MTTCLLAATTFAGFALLNAWFSGRRIVISRTGDIFMLTWFYYGFAISIDILLGMDIPAFRGMPDIADEAWQPVLVRVLSYYLACGAAFFIAYMCVRPRDRRARPRDPVVLPPVPVILVAHILLLLLLYHGGYYALTRPQRILLASQSLSLRILMLSMSILFSLDFMIIIFSNGRRQVFVTAAAAICLGVLNGGRMELMAVILILMLKYRISTSRLKFAAAVLVLLGVFACWKSAYQYVHVKLFEHEANQAVLEFATSSLSGIDSYASSLISVMAMEGDCPYYCGRTYTYDVAQMALPSELRDPSFLPLSQTFDWEYMPQRAEEGISMAFSAVAEAWMNFGLFGPAVLGLVFGIAAKLIDSGRRGILFYVFALTTFRLFRSDFASLCKNWIVIYGASMLACYYACLLLTYLVAPLRAVSSTRQIGRLRPSIQSLNHK